MIPILICLLATLSIGLLTLAAWPRHSAVHARVAQLGGTQSEIERRIVVFEQIYDDKAKGKLQQRLQEAGWYNTSPALMGIVTIGSLALGTALTLALIFILHVQGLLMFATIALPAIGYMLPNVMLSNAIKKRKAAIQTELPDFIDMVSSTVAAGIALNGAFISAVDMCTGPLGDEFRATLSDIRMGRSRAEALSSMAQRVNQTDLTQMVTTITQSERVGGNITQVLEELAQESRERRLMRAEEIAGTLPIKMSVTMAFLLLPALFVVIFGPVVANMKY
jgi:tight adherence protein C